MALPVIKIENAKGEVLNFSADPRYFARLEGVGPPPATINRNKIATAPGTRYNSSTVGERPLTLEVSLLRDAGRARVNLYRWIASGEYIKVHYKTDELDVWAEGYVETPEVDPWVQEQKVLSSILCPYPYWRDHGETYTDATNVDALFEFPFAIDSAGVEMSTLDIAAATEITNGGQVATGARFEIKATARCLQPRIYNIETGEWMGFYVDLFAGERLVIDTNRGRKSVTHIVDGVAKNYINTIMPGSTWLQLGVGKNAFSYTTDEGAINLGVYHTNNYLGA